MLVKRAKYEMIVRRRFRRCSPPANYLLSGKLCAPDLREDNKIKWLLAGDFVDINQKIRTCDVVTLV